ncbi:MULTISPECIES: ribbon-helix-helix domain-containing protein [unclassified Sphingomonas]|uniref:ribbon-helix-helix domain-containing protein n=1 Tax=unclassified Sphingomonas TaxID=196159 RepID=UPI002269D552|nr:ribbon-helix-helix domain-containing protein [Sphingomonas sp. GM_Shp_2]
MARRTSLLAPAVPAPTPPAASDDATAPSPAPAEKPAAARTGGKRPGKYHLGAYFDPADPSAEAFRVLAARTRRSHQELLAEAIADLVAKYDAERQFGRS